MFLEAAFEPVMLYWYKSAIKSLKIPTFKNQITNYCVGWLAACFISSSW